MHPALVIEEGDQLGAGRRRFSFLTQIFVKP
jgi:hypothetical protein